MEIKILHGDSQQLLKTLQNNSIDSVVTDPPYGINFMNKKWDYDVPSTEVWKEVFRVIKPGGHILVACGTRTQHRMAVNIEDAGFEIRDVISWIYGCYSDDTEVLTQRGWLHHSELKTSDQVLQWNKDNNKLSWVKPSNKFEYDIDDEMVLFENRHTSQLITKNHSVFAKIRKHSRNPKPTEFEKIEAGQIRRNWQIDLPIAGKLDGSIKITYPYLLGWWMTDAWIHGDGKAAMFSQSKPKTLEKLRNELDRLNLKYSEYIKKGKKESHQDEHTFYVTGDVANYLLAEYKEREFNWDILQWLFNDRMLFLEGLLDGDGSRSNGKSGRGYSEVFWSKKNDRLDIVQALCLSLNIRSHIDYKKGCVYLNRMHNTTQLQAKHKLPLQDYKGKIWCLETKTGAFVVRRNGRAFISGNSGFPKSLDVSKAIDKAAGAEREVVGTKNLHGYKSKDCGNSMGNGFRKDFEKVNQLTAPATDEAKKWEGFGTAIKPSTEFFTLARKPLFEKTIAANVLKWGTGAINIDESRVPLNGEDNPTGSAKRVYAKNKYIEDKIYGDNKTTPDKGRFPANLIHDGSDEVISQFPNTKSGKVRENKSAYVSDSNTGFLKGNSTTQNQHGDSGSASRFFYCAKASKKERGEGNNHATVKPIKLMEYLVRLITPPGGTVLDCYAGSGTTGLACQNLGFNCVMIEREKEHVDIINKRVEAKSLELFLEDIL